MLILTFNDSEEKAVGKVIAALADKIEFEVMRSVSSPMLSFSGLEIRQHQRRVLRNTDISPVNWCASPQPSGYRLTCPLIRCTLSKVYWSMIASWVSSNISHWSWGT